MENKKGYIITIVIVMLISLAAVGYIVYEKFIVKTDEDKEYITVIKDASIDINKLYGIGEILDKFDKAYASSESKYVGYIYSTPVIEVKDFDKNAGIYAAMYSDMIRSNTEQTISNEIVKNRYQSIFGKSLEYKPSGLDLGENLTVEYDKENKAYKYIATITNNDHKSEYLARNMKTTLKDDLVIVTRKVFYVEYSGSSAIIYTNSSKTTKVGQVSLIDGEVSLKEVTGKYGSKLSTYDVTFKLGSDDEYYFYKIEKTK